MDMATHVHGHRLTHNPGRMPQVAMIHKLRIGESTEKQHVLPFGRATRQNANRSEIGAYLPRWRPSSALSG
jgi:hypothetical protein